MPLHKLKALAVQALNKPNTKHSDGGGLYLQVGPHRSQILVFSIHLTHYRQGTTIRTRLC